MDKKEKIVIPTPETLIKYSNSEYIKVLLSNFKYSSVKIEEE